MDVDEAPLALLVAPPASLGRAAASLTTPSPPADRALDMFAVRIENGIVKVDTGKTIRRQRFEKSQAVYP